MAGSPKKRARRAALDGAGDIRARSASERQKAELAATEELTAWWRAEKARLEADQSLSEPEREQAKRALMLEFMRRSKRALAKAKRDTSPAKLLERDARDEIERRRRW